MAEIVNRRQAIRRAAPTPASYMSRDIAVELKVGGGVGVSDYAITPTMGRAVQLHSIDLWLFPDVKDLWIGGLIWLTTGSGKEVNSEIVSVGWQPILDMSMCFKNSLLWYGYGEHFHFDVNQRFAGESRRFGCAISNMTVNQFWAIGVFQISEG